MAAGKPKKSASRRTALVVLGMHRSGTSALTGVLSHLGCDLAKTLQPGDRNNPRGYFESVQFYTINDALMTSAASSWDDWNEINPAWYDSPRHDEFVAKAADVLTQEYGESGFFLMKDPRICRLLPIWQSALQKYKATPLYVTIHRHPNDVAKSLSMRDGWSLGRGLLVWLRNVLDAEAASRGGRRVFVRYESLLADWQTTVQQIADGLKIGWPVRLESASPAIATFLEPDLRRQRASDGPERNMVFVQGWVAEVFSILNRWSEAGEDKSDHARLDAIRAAFSAAAPLMSALLSDMDQDTKEAAQVSVALTARAAAEARLSELEQVLSSTQAELGRSHSGLGEAQSAASAAQQALSTLRIEHQTLQTELQATQRDRSALSERLQSLETALTDSRKAAADLEGRLHHAESAVVQRGQEADDLWAESRVLKDALSARIQSLETALTDSQKAAADLESRLHHAESAVVQRGQEADDLRAEVDAHRTLLTQSEADREAALAALTDKTANNQALVKEFHIDRSGLVEELEKLETALMRSRAVETVNQTRLNEAVAKVEAAERERISLLGEQDRMSAEIASLTSRLNAGLAEADAALMQRITALEQNIAALVNSTSWKVTAPLRRLSRVLGRG